MHPIDALIREHRSIEQVLAALYRASMLGRSGLHVPEGLFTDAVAFIQRYADGVHHMKEERHLFPLIERIGLMQGEGPLRCMLAEHGDARRYAEHISQEAELARDGDPRGSTLLYQAATLYARHMVSHIEKEDRVLFVLARRLIEDDDLADLAAAFRRIDAEMPGLEASAAAIYARVSPAPGLSPSSH